MTARIDQARSISDALSRLDDAGVLRLVDAAERVGTGIGGTTKTATVAGSRVFVKQLPLPRAEEADPTATTARVRLPFVCHYGIGSPSHGVGRELAAHQVTTGWVHQEAVDFFPLLLDWRIVDRPCETDLREFDGAAPPRQWGSHWPQVSERLEAMKEASKSVVLFLEYVPETLGAWLRRSLAEGTGAAAFAEAVNQLLEAAAWMKTQGFQHFDVHPGNILVRDGRLLFTDFGLSLYREFDLGSEEAEAMPEHAEFDRDTALMHLFHWVLFELGYTSGPQRLHLLAAAAAEPDTPELDPVRTALGNGADLIAQHAPAAVYATEMFGALMQDASATRYENTHVRSLRR